MKLNTVAFIAFSLSLLLLTGQMSTGVSSTEGVDTVSSEMALDDETAPSVLLQVLNLETGPAYEFKLFLIALTPLIKPNGRLLFLLQNCLPPPALS